MFHYLILAVVIVVLISIIYWIFMGGDSAKRKKSEKLLRGSVGTFDENARAALNELTRIHDPEPDDYFRRGNIIQYNLLEGDILRRTRGRERRAAVGHIVRDYTDALVGMHGRVGVVGGERNIHPDFMVHRIEDFNLHLAEFNDDDDELMRLIYGFNDTVNAHAPAVRQEIINQRRNQALAAANTRAEAIEAYFDTAQNYTNDMQNVHDNTVNSDLVDTLSKLKQTASGGINPNECVDEIREYIHGEYSRDPDNRRKVANASRILNRMVDGNVVLPFNEREDRILAYTWERCKHPNNRANTKLMREAVVNSLADAVENGSEVCPNGRVGRVLSSLVTLDYDTNVANGPLTTEAYRNQIFQETKEIINRKLEQAMASNDPDLKAVAEAYEGADIDVKPDVEERFKNNIKNEIDRNMDCYSGKLSDAVINKTREECYVYATL